MDLHIDKLSEISFYYLDGVNGLPSVDPFSMEILLLLQLNKCDKISVHKCKFAISAHKLPCLKVDDVILTDPGQILRIVKQACQLKIDTMYEAQTILFKIGTYKAHAELYCGRSALMFYWGPENNATISSQNYCKSIYFPFSWLFARSQRKKVAEIVDWIANGEEVTKVLENVLPQMDTYFDDLSTLIGDNRYIFGSTPTSLDVYICSQLALAKRVEYPNKQFISLINKHSKVSNYVDRFLNKYCPFKSSSTYDGSLYEDRASPVLLFTAGSVAIAAMVAFAMSHGIVRFN